MSINFKKQSYAKIDMRLISLYELLRWVQNGILEADSSENRKLRWSVEGKSQLMESVLEGIPVQAVFLAETENGKLKIVDGAQRIKTILEFLRNGFSLLSREADWNGRKFQDLSMVEQRRIEDFQLVAYIIRNDNDAAVQEQVFDRLNLNQQKYSSQEIRNYKYRNQGIPFIRQMAENKDFLDALQDKDINFNALQHHELVLRFMSFYFKGYKNYTGNMKDFLDDTLKQYESYESRQEKFLCVFKKVFRTVGRIWGNEAFSTGRDDKRVNLALYDVITYSFASYAECELVAHAEQIRKLPLELLEKNPEFREAVKGVSNTSRSKVKKRFAIWLNELKTILGENNAY